MQLIRKHHEGERSSDLFLCMCLFVCWLVFKLQNTVSCRSQYFCYYRCLQIYTQECFLFHALLLPCECQQCERKQSFSWTLKNKQLWNKSPSVSAGSGWSDRNLNYAQIHGNIEFRKWENHQGLKNGLFYDIVKLFWMWAKSTHQWCWCKLIEAVFTYSETLTCMLTRVTQSVTWSTVCTYPNGNVIFTSCLIACKATKQLSSMSLQFEFRARSELWSSHTSEKGFLIP